MPMHHTRFASLARAASALAMVAVLSCAHAAELGETVVRSHIGQPLIADIELTQLADPSVAVVVRLAHPDVYKGANIAMHPVLSSLNMSVMRRDGRQFLHITSIKPVDSEYLHLFVELIEGNKRNVRAETLWLTPDPTPAPPPKPAPVAAPAPAPVAAATPAPLVLPPKPAPILPKPALVIPSPPPAARTCPTAEQVQACAETDYKNGLLSAQIVELEEKVKALELAMKGRTELPPAELPTAAPARLGPPPPVKAAAPKKEAGLPWLLIGGGLALLAAIGGGLFFFLKRRKGKAGDAPDAPAPGKMAGLLARLRRKKADAPQVEPELPKEG